MSQPEVPGPQPPKPKPPITGFGIALLVIGLLILIPSGLCTGIFGIGALSELVLNPENANDALGTVIMALMVGGIPLAIGAALTYAGWKMRRRD